MGDEPRKELMSSMHEVFRDPKYSDLTIICGKDEYKVHRVIVCPRSKFPANSCNGGFKEAHTARISLHHNDRQAVKLMVHYFYHLDYPHISLYGDGDGDHKGTFGDVNGGAETAGTSNEKLEEVIPSEPEPLGEEVPIKDPPMLSGAPIPEVEPKPTHEGEAPIKASKKYKKKLKGRKGSIVEVPPPPPPEPEEYCESPSHPIDEDAPSQPLILSPKLIIHAKVYALAEEYHIKGLKALALEKFEAGIEQHWNSSEFAQAAYEVYTSTVESDKGLRDIIVQTLHAHPELLDKKEVQAVAKKSSLAYDMMMYVRGRGFLGMS